MERTVKLGWHCLAMVTSFEEFLTFYAKQLEEGLFSVDGEGFIESLDEQDTLTWGVPDGLQ